MKSWVRIGVLALASMTVAYTSANACTWGVGYFHQVTALRGKIVHRIERSILGFRVFGSKRPLSNAGLTLYRYRHPYWLVRENEIASTSTDPKGEFDFGNIARGHYTLAIREGELEEFFDVEVTDDIPETELSIIDVTPVSPDCTGGHTFTTYPKGKNR